MDSLASYLPSFLYGLADSVSFDSRRDDFITSLEFADIQIADEVLPCLLIGYERGFQLWNVTQIHTPKLLLSKRNTGVACIKHVPISTDCLVAYSPLYTTHAAPKSCIYLYSGLANELHSEVRAPADVVVFEVNTLALVASLASNELAVYSTADWSLTYKVECGCIGKYAVAVCLSPIYLAWALKPRQELTEEHHAFSLSSLAEASLSTVKGFLETPNSAVGSVSVRSLQTGTGFATIQAFTEPVAQLKLSGSSGILVVAPSTGHSFHVYALGQSARYTLIYTLHRGVTTAEISSIEVSLDESWVVVASSKGTFHIYKITPETKSLNYNVRAYARIKTKSLLSDNTHPQCKLQLGTGVTPEYSQGEVIYEPSPPELVCVNRRGVLSKYVLHRHPLELAAVNLLRPANFREKDFCE